MRVTRDPLPLTPWRYRQTLLDVNPRLVWCLAFCITDGKSTMDNACRHLRWLAQQAHKSIITMSDVVSKNQNLCELKVKYKFARSAIDRSKTKIQKWTRNFSSDMKNLNWTRFASILKKWNEIRYATVNIQNLINIQLGNARSAYTLFRYVGVEERI